MQKLLCVLFIFLFSTCFAQNKNWQHHWHNGRSYCFQGQYLEASSEFDLAVDMMSEIELERCPFVLVDRAENDYYLGYDLKVFQDTENALKSTNLTDQERLICGLRRISILSKNGEDTRALDEYRKYIINCPLFPKYDFSEEKIIIRNVLDCNCYKNSSKQLMLSEFCEKEEDIHEYGSTWVVDITKKNKSCCSECSESKAEHIHSPCISQERNGDQIQGCCNTCNKLAVAASVICGCLSIPTGPLSSIACKVACSVFVEEIRQVCERCCHNGGIEGKCWKKFETWKSDFKQKNSNCPHPLRSCS